MKEIRVLNTAEEGECPSCLNPANDDEPRVKQLYICSISEHNVCMIAPATRFAALDASRRVVHHVLRRLPPRCRWSRSGDTAP